MTPALVLEGITKLYRIGQLAKRPDTLVGSALWAMKSSVREYRRLARLGRFDDEREEDILWALRDVSFEVPRGQVLGIVSRITPPTHGRARVRGRISSLLEVGTGFHPEFTGRENIFLNGTILGMTEHEIRQKLDSIIEFAGVERFIDTPVKRYSSGMSVRLAFAVAAHLEPDVLIVDEVLAVGDAEFQAKCIGKMKEVSQGGGRTVLFVSHNLGAVRQLCDRAILLEAGRVVLDDEPGVVVEHYLNSGIAAERVATWSNGDGPASDEIDLSAIAIRDPAGGTSSPLRTSDELSIDVSYRVKTPIRDMRVVLTLLSGDGTQVLMSSDYHAQPDNRLRAKGKYVTRCRLPGNLLNAGSYVAIIDFEIPMTRAILSEQRIAFTIPELSVNQVGRMWASRPPGVIHPSLDWRVQRIE
jgi:lipopolysaccharide transport system ATP-binding protein